MKTLREIQNAISNSGIIAIKVRSTGKVYRRGENPYYDMEMDNFTAWSPDCGENWHGFIRENYEPVYNYVQA